MKTIATAATALAAVLVLSACGKADNAAEQANPDNVEMPAEEAMGGVDATAAPVAEATAGADATGAATEAATAATPEPAAAASAAAQ